MPYRSNESVKELHPTFRIGCGGLPFTADLCAYSAFAHAQIVYYHGRCHVIFPKRHGIGSIFGIVSKPNSLVGLEAYDFAVVTILVRDGCLKEGLASESEEDNHNSRSPAAGRAANAAPKQAGGTGCERACLGLRGQEAAPHAPRRSAFWLFLWI
jgi:hypothetical protein